MNRCWTSPREPAIWAGLGTREALRERIGQELDGGPPTGLRPHRGQDGTVQLTHIWATVTATVPMAR
jgi:hypothetical protein